MTLRLLTCFSLLAFICQGASVKGSISITDQGGKDDRHDPSGTVIWLQPELEVTNHSTLPKLRMIQKNKTFLPHVLAVPVGSSVDFPNFDPIFHNAFSSYNGQIFDVGLYPPGASRSVTFRREGVVRVFCNIHSAMSAVIVVLRTPFYTVSQPDGTFQIDGVPDGTYSLSVYYERATEQMLASRSRKVEIVGPSQNLGTITISESGYLPMPHMNKYGKSYGPNPDSATYPGARP